MTFDECKQEMIKIVESVGRVHGIWTVFEDFMLLIAYEVAIAVDLGYKCTFNRKIDEVRLEKRLEAYKKTIEKYQEPEKEQFKKFYELLCDGLTRKRTDLLGQIFMELNLGDGKYKGQYFTPPHMAEFMASIGTTQKFETEIANKGYVTMSDPCIGAGVMAISFCEALREKGCHFWNMFVEGADIDKKACYMSYIQLSLLGIPAVIFHRDSLSMQTWESFETPIAVYHGWISKIYHNPSQTKQESQTKPQEEEKRVFDFEHNKEGQLILF